jgi:GNAT superfamily N-acetyltransferase
LPIQITALTDPDRGPSSYRLAWLASGLDSIPVGSAFLRFFTSPEQDHLAELELTVHPAQRRTGVGSRLLEAAVTGAIGEGRRTLVTQVEADSPGDAFLAAKGFRVVLTLTYARLPMEKVDLAALAEETGRKHPGYRLDSWQGAVPDDLAQTFAASRRAMDDMPMDDADYAPQTWDVERLHAAAAAIEKRGHFLYTVVAIDETDGSIAGFTELVVPGDGRGDAQHYGTGVLPEHRGHGLARWMKAESIRQARERYPHLDALLADTADSNPYMRGINDTLGYVPTHRTLMYQLDFEQSPKRS